MASLLDEFFPRTDGVSAVDVMAVVEKSQRQKKPVIVTFRLYRAVKAAGYSLKNVRITGAPLPPPEKGVRKSARWF